MLGYAHHQRIKWTVRENHFEEGLGWWGVQKLSRWTCPLFCLFRSTRVSGSSLAWLCVVISGFCPKCCDLCAGAAECERSLFTVVNYVYHHHPTYRSVSCCVLALVNLHKCIPHVHLGAKHASCRCRLLGFLKGSGDLILQAQTGFAV